MITSVPVVPPWDQGDKNLAYALTGALPQHRFTVLTARQSDAPAGGNLKPEPVYRSSRPSMGQKARVYRRLLLTPPGRAGADLYHFVYRPYAVSSWLCRLLPEFRRRPTLHTVPATAGDKPLARHLFFADWVVALSEFGRRKLEMLGLKRVRHIPPGIDVAGWMALQSQTDSFKAQLGLSKGPVILFPGHYGPGYGAELVVRALSKIVAGVPRAQVLFACRLRDPDDRRREAATRQAVAGMGLARNVHFYNTVSNMKPLIGASDLTLLPLQTMRNKVDIPTTLIESLAAGKPVITTDLPPMNELVAAPGGASDCRSIGLTVPPGDSGAVAEAALTLLQDASLRRAMGRQGQRVAQQRFDIRHVAQQYHTLYREMLQ
ncbi:MAG: glycosyltransferase family 4 protein [Anaerolineae bacterium]